MKNDDFRVSGNLIDTTRTPVIENDGVISAACRDFME